MEMDKTHLNFAVGPVQMDPQVQALGGEPVPYFRTQEFSDLMKENEALMCSLMHAPEGARAVFLTGSGTAAMEAAVMNLFDSRDRLLIVEGGSFGHRFCEICDCHGIPYDTVCPPVGRSFGEAELAPFAGGGYSGVLVNMHETSTGVLYNMELLGEFCRREGYLLVVDAISAFLVDPLDMEAIGANLVLTGSQKALATPPGISIVVMDRAAMARLDQTHCPTYYLNLTSALKNGERGQTPFTPAVGILIQMNHRLVSLAAAGGAKAENQRAKEMADYFRRRIADYPFRIAATDLSSGVTPLTPTGEGVDAYEVFLTLKNDYHIVVCPNGGETAHTVFRVGHMGNLTKADYDTLLSALDHMKERKLL